MGKKSYKVCKQTGKCDQYIRKKANNWNSLWKDPDVRLNRQKLQGSYYKYVQRLKKTTLREEMGGLTAMSYQKEISNREKLFRRIKWKFGIENYNN